MAQFALLIILLIIVLQLFSGGNTPIESQPEWMQRLTLVLPSRHFVAFSQAIIYRGAGLDTVWPQFLAVAGIGLAVFCDEPEVVPPVDRSHPLAPVLETNHPFLLAYPELGGSPHAPGDDSWPGSASG